MKIITTLIFAFVFSICTNLNAQAPAYDDLTMESDEITDTYHAAGGKYALIKSKKGTGGMPHTSTGDSIKTFSIKEIVLVFSETTEAAYDEREDANRERWENLIKTYPEFFQTNTVYKSICQCNLEGNAEAFKHAQGFYVYYVGKSAPAAVVVEKPVEVKKVEEKKPEEKIVEKKEEKKVDASTSSATKKEEKKSDASTSSATKKEEEKKQEKKVEEKKAEEKVVKEEKVIQEEVKPPVKTETEEVHEEHAKVVPQKKTAIGKQRRAKDPKACRPACYETGDDDLNNYFKTAISLTKKEKRHVKKYSSTVKIYLNHDGSIKKSIVTGEDEMLNKKLQGAVNGMNNWNPAVKNGLTVKSEIKITVKFDREFKGMKPSDITYIPKPGPKCKCISDAEMFGSGD